MKRQIDIKEGIWGEKSHIEVSGTLVSDYSREDKLVVCDKLLGRNMEAF